MHCRERILRVAADEDATRAENARTAVTWRRGAVVLHSDMRSMLRCLMAACALGATSCRSLPTPPVPNPDETEEMTAAIDVQSARREMRAFAARYDYDMAYLELLLDLSPSAYAAFTGARRLSRHQGPLSPEVHAVACIAAMLRDDCGACTQLHLRMAAEAGIDRAILAAQLDDPSTLPPLLRLVHEHSQHVVGGDNAHGAAVAELRRELGDEGFAALSVTIVGCRIYPALKRALGEERTCRAPRLDP